MSGPDRASQQTTQAKKQAWAEAERRRSCQSQALQTAAYQGRLSLRPRDVSVDVAAHFPHVRQKIRLVDVDPVAPGVRREAPGRESVRNRHSDGGSDAETQRESPACSGNAPVALKAHEDHLDRGCVL